MAPGTTVDLTAGLARRVRAIRKQHGLTQDDVAERARQLGLGWSQATVAKIEASGREGAGGREVGLAEFLLLPLILAGADVSTTVADLLPVGVDYVELAKWAAVPRESFLGLLAGERNLYNELLRPTTLTVGGRPPPILRDAHREAERKAAKRLGLDPVELSTLAHKRWGMGLTERRDQLLTEQAKAGDARTRQALRGWVTRQLDKELTQKEVKK